VTTPPPHLPARVTRDPEPPPVRRGGLSRWPLPWTILGAVGLGGGATVGTYWLLGRAVVINYAEGLTGAQRLTAAFATATAIGAIVALVVNVRKQDLAERTAAQAEAQYAETIFRDRESAFTDRFRAASQQLGAAAPPERIAGVYAMAALADDYADRRQQCVDVLCGYLRLPWDPNVDDLAATSTVMTTPGPDGTSTAQSNTPARRPHDAEVRATILATIAAHTRHENPSTSWTALDFNLRRAHLADAIFTGCQFAGRTSFEGAAFSGERTSFEGAAFSGERTSFQNAAFSTTHTSFDGAKFSGDDATFEEATFSGDWASFQGATFSSLSTRFGKATFLSRNTSFLAATIYGFASFEGARFSGERTSFAAALSGHTTFEGATFSAQTTWFLEATFSGHTTFEGATFSGHTTFEGATFSGEDTSFERAAFSGRTSFEGATFSGQITRFGGVRLHVGAVLWLPGIVDPDSVLSGLRIEDGGQVLLDGKPYIPPDLPQTQGEGSSS